MKRTLVIGACVSALAVGPAAAAAAAADAAHPRAATASAPASPRQAAQQRALFDPFIGLLNQILPIPIPSQILQLPEQLLGLAGNLLSGTLDTVLQSVVVPVTSVFLKPMSFSLDAPGFTVQASFTPKTPLEGSADPIKTLLDVAGSLGVTFTVNAGDGTSYVCTLPGQLFTFALDTGQPRSTTRATVRGTLRSGGEDVPVVGTAEGQLPPATPVGDPTPQAAQVCQAASAALDPSLPDVSIELTAGDSSLQILGLRLPKLVSGVLGKLLSAFTTVTNSTDETLRNVVVRVSPPAGVRASQRRITIRRLAPGASKKVRFKLRAGDDAARSSKVKVTVAGGGLRSSESLRLRLRSR